MGAALAWYRLNLRAALWPYLPRAAFADAGRAEETHRLMHASPVAPTLVVAGVDDGCIGADVARDAVARARFEGPVRFDVLPTGHFPQLEAPQDLADSLLAWVQPSWARSGAAA